MKWIPVDYKLPEISKKYLVWVDDYADIDYFFTGAKTKWGQWKSFGEDVTHWCEIEPPMKETEGIAVIGMAEGPE